MHSAEGIEPYRDATDQHKTESPEAVDEAHVAQHDADAPEHQHHRRYRAAIGREKRRQVNGFIFHRVPHGSPFTLELRPMACTDSPIAATHAISAERRVGTEGLLSCRPRVARCL